MRYALGSPFKNLNSGRDELADKENLSRVKQAFANYLASECIAYEFMNQRDKQMQPHLRSQQSREPEQRSPDMQDPWEED